MKKISSLILAFMAIASAMPMKAQCFTVSPEVGYQLTTCHVTRKHHQPVSIHSCDGFRLGASATYRLNNGLSFQSGIFYSRGGIGNLYDVDDQKTFPYVKDINLKTADFFTVPLTLGYELQFASRWGIGVEAGGYIASGLGKGSSFFRCTNGEGSAGSIFDDSVFTVGDLQGNDRTRVTVKGSGRIDAGCMFGAHIRFDRISLKAAYQLGLCKTVYDMAMPRTFVISLAYDFKLWQKP